MCVSVCILLIVLNLVTSVLEVSSNESKQIEL